MGDSTSIFTACFFSCLFLFRLPVGEKGKLPHISLWAPLTKNLAIKHITPHGSASVMKVVTGNTRWVDNAQIMLCNYYEWAITNEHAMRSTAMLPVTTYGSIISWYIKCLTFVVKKKTHAARHKKNKLKKYKNIINIIKKKKK